MDPLSLFLIFLKASALSISGLASLPLLRADLVPTFATDEQIVQAIVIGRLTPGPNGLYVVSLGYLVAGWTGAAIALTTACLAPLVVLPATSLARRWMLSGWFGGLVRGVSLATIGLLTATGVTIVIASGTAPWQLALTGLAVVLTIQGRLHPALLVVVGGIGGLALGR